MTNKILIRLSGCFFALLILFTMILLFMDCLEQNKTRPRLQTILDNPGVYKETIIEAGGRIVDEDTYFFYFKESDYNKQIQVSKSQLDGIKKLGHINKKLDSILIYAKIYQYDDGTVMLIIKDYKIQKNNFIKYGLSVIGLMIFLFIFFKEWKITPKGFTEVHKNA